MTNSPAKPILTGALMAVLAFGVSAAYAAEHLSEKLNSALARKNLSEVEALLAQSPSNVDEVVKALLRATQSTIGTDPDFSGKMMSLAGQYAPQITPPTVPSVCADLRRIVEALPANQAGTPLYSAVVAATQNFAKAPVVVAAGRPNLCEDAWLLIANEDGDALLAQQPGFRSPILPWGPPNTPPNDPPPTVKPSAD